MNKKLFLIMFLVISICSLFIGSYAYYRIVVQNKISLSTGNAVFNFKGSNNEDLKTISLNDGNKVFPGNSGSFDITLDASGSNMDIYVTLEIDRGNLPTNLKFYTTSDHRSELHKYYSFLEKNKTNSETLTIYWYWNPYISNDEDNKFMNLDKLEATIKVNAKQISKYAVMKNGYSSDENMNGGTEFWNNNYKQYIRTIKFDNNLSNLPSNCTEENLCFDITDDSSSNKVYGYLVDSGLTVTETDSDENTIDKVLYNLYIVSDSLIFAPTSCTQMFYLFTNLVSIDFNDNFNTSKVEKMMYMFYDCYSLKQLDLSKFNTSNVTLLQGMFCNCYNLLELDLSNFNTGKVETMRDLFAFNKSLKSINLSSFNTSNVTIMKYMFQACNLLEILDVSSFDTTNVTDMSDMFNDCYALKELNLLNFNTSNVEDMSKMFRSCVSLTSIDLSYFNTSKVKRMEKMFFNCNKLVILDLSNFNTTNVVNMQGMFAYLNNLKYLNLESFNTSNVEDMSDMFYDCFSLSTEITIMNKDANCSNIFYNAATKENTKIVVNYTAETSTLVDNIIINKSNILKGSQL